MSVHNVPRALSLQWMTRCNPFGLVQRQAGFSNTVQDPEPIYQNFAHQSGSPWRIFIRVGFVYEKERMALQIAFGRAARRAVPQRWSTLTIRISKILYTAKKHRRMARILEASGIQNSIEGDLFSYTLPIPKRQQFRPRNG